MSVTRRTMTVVVLAMLVVAALVVTSLQSYRKAVETVSNTGVVAVVADAKAKEAN